MTLVMAVLSAKIFVKASTLCKIICTRNSLDVTGNCATIGGNKKPPWRICVPHRLHQTVLTSVFYQGFEDIVHAGDAIERIVNEIRPCIEQNLKKGAEVERLWHEYQRAMLHLSMLEAQHMHPLLKMPGLRDSLYDRAKLMTTFTNARKLSKTLLSDGPALPHHRPAIAASHIPSRKFHRNRSSRDQRRSGA